MLLKATGSLLTTAIVPEVWWGPQNQTRGHLKPDCSLSVSMGHMLLVCLTYYSQTPPRPASILLFLLHAHTCTIPCVQKDRWDAPKPQVLLYL